MEDRIGQQLGNYKILRMVGQGGFADVYLGEHIHLRTQAAIKVLQVRLGENNKQNFLNEARTIAHLVHPYIVRVLDFGIQDNTPFLVMDYAPNGTFRQRFLQGKPLPAAPLVPYIKQTAAALQYGHDKKLIHRDVKPENMLLSHNEEVLLSDFGLAVIAYTSASRSPTETAGTAAYMAPEQLQGKPRPASDQYALGMIAYEWITGTCPFQGSFFEIASQQVLTPPPPMRDKAPQTPPEIEKVIMRALEKDPQQRFPSVRDFALALEESCLVSKQYSFTLSNQVDKHDSAPGAFIHANSGFHPPIEHVGPEKAIRRTTEDSVEQGGRPAAKFEQGPRSTSTKYPAGLGQAPAAMSQPERLRPAIHPANFSHTPPATSPHHSGGPSNSLSNIRPLPAPPVSQANLPTYSGPGPVSQRNLPVYPGQPQSSGQSFQDQATRQQPYPFPNEQRSPRSTQDFSFPSGQTFFPTERSPRGPNSYPPSNAPASSPHLGQEGHITQTRPETPDQFSSGKATPPAFAKAPLGARPISQANPALMAALQQSRFSDTYTVDKIPETPGSMAGPYSTPLAGASGQRDTLKTARERDEQIAAKFAFKTSTDNEQAVNTRPLQRLTHNKLVVAIVAVLVIAAGVGISLFVGNNAVQQQQSATATSVAIQSTATANKNAAAVKATATARVKQADTNPYATNGASSLVLNDPLTSNHNSWQEGADSTAVTAGTCAFTDQGYKIAAPALEPTMCFENKDTYSNFTYQVDMKFTNIGQSFSGAGIVFHGNPNTKEYYFFEIYSSGNYALQKCTADAGCDNQMDGYKLGKPALSAFKPGTNVTNTLAVVANGDSFTLFVNKQKISSVTDQVSAPFTSGNIGLMATGGNDTGVDSTTNTPTDVIFSQAKIWK